MPNITNAVSVNITSTDDILGNTEISKSVSSSYDSNQAYFNAYGQVGNAGYFSIIPPLTLGTIYQVYVKNNDPTSQLGVQLSPVGGAAVLAVVLNPQDFILIFQKTSGNVNAGFSNVYASCLSNALICKYEAFFGS